MPALDAPVTVLRPPYAMEADPSGDPDAPPRSGVHLHPGHLHASATTCTIATILGSCVSVCLYDRVRGIGGANHFLLPYPVSGEQASPRFGLAAVRGLIDRLVGLGSSPSNLEAKLFGGAAVVPALRARPGHLGLQNVEVAREILDAHGIPVRAEDVGGERGRKLVFRTHDGAAWVRLL